MRNAGPAGLEAGRRGRVWRLLVLALALVPGSVSALQVPKYEGWITDLAQVVDPEHRGRITSLIQAVKENTGAEIAVLTVPTTGDEPIFDYAMAVAEQWKPGEKGKDNGVLFVVAVHDRKLQILVGYGLEGILPDGKIGEIEDRYVIPAFRRGDYGEGILLGVQALAAVIDPSQRAAGGEGEDVSRIPSEVSGNEEFSPGQKILGICMLVAAALIWLYLFIRHPRLALFLLLFFVGGGGRRSGGGGFGGGFGGGGFGGGGAGRSW